jgi:aspartyl-tRNA synthetase
MMQCYITDATNQTLEIHESLEICPISWQSLVKNGAKVRSMNVANCAKESRSFFDKPNDWAMEIGLPGRGYISMESTSEFEGPIVKINKMNPVYTVLFICQIDAQSLSGLTRTKIAQQLDLIKKTLSCLNMRSSNV